jgi:glyoxalase family protein
MTVTGLHHVTATVDDAQEDLDFCLGALGLRLVKKTVNFDNHHVYHFYYGDERVTPGTIWTTFPYRDRGVPAGSPGAGQVTVTSFSVPNGSLAFWRRHLGARSIPGADLPARFGEPVLRFSDRSGLTFELIGTARDQRRPWLANGFDDASAVRGLHSVTMVVGDATRTLELMTGLLGWAVADQSEHRIRLTVNGGGPGRTIDLAVRADAGPAKNGLGTVHHVAMAVESADDQLRLRDELIHYGCKVTDVRDRCYFQSIYFREPGGVLFEIATISPGFTVDEDVASLGRDLKLPPWEEPSRAAIEPRLAPVHY